jgi:hypothetical protein
MVRVGPFAPVIGCALRWPLDTRRGEGWSMGSNATTWDVILHYWTVTMFVPLVLLVIATLAVLTRVIDD